MFKKKQLILQLLSAFFEKLIYDNVSDEGKIVASLALRERTKTPHPEGGT